MTKSDISAALQKASDAVAEHFRFGNEQGAILPDDAALRAISAFLEAMTGQGWELKPREVTDEMRQACPDASNGWRDMFDAAPRIEVKGLADQAITSALGDMPPCIVEGRGSVWIVSAGGHREEDEDLLVAMQKLAALLNG